MVKKEYLYELENEIKTHNIMSLNKVMLIGNAGKDPDVRHLESGATKASFTLATTERYKDRNGEVKEQTEWHNVVCWRFLAETVEKYVRKGKQLYVEGKLTTRQYTDSTGAAKYITEIVADTIQMLGRREESEAPSALPSGTYQNRQEETRPAAPQPAAEEEASDDLPF